jgi:hypothetical protein
MRYLVPTLALAAIAAGCAAPVNREMQHAIAASLPECTAGADCNAKWNAAQVWVATRAGWKLQTVTDSVIQTFGPSTRAEVSTRLAVQVIRTPLGGDRFAIVATISCGNPFGCTPDAAPMQLDFNRTVSAAKAGTAPVAAPMATPAGMVFEEGTPGR